MKAEIKNGMLVIEIPINPEPRLSSTGKSLLVATETAVTGAIVKGKPVKVTLSAYIPAN